MSLAPASLARRNDALVALSFLAAIAMGTTAALAQSALVPATAPSVITGPVAPITPPAPATPPASLAPEAPAVTEPFVGTVTADKVYVRSGPGSAWYDIGHLAKGDTVQVVGSKAGWFQIFPPNGAYCLIAKEFVETDAGGQTGTVKGDYINLRAGTATYKQEGVIKDNAVLCVVRKGTKLTILGTADKYYEVAPTDRAYVYINPQFIKAAPGTDYKIPELKLNGGQSGPAKDTVTAIAPLPTAAAPSAAPLISGETPMIRPGNTDTATTTGAVAETRPDAAVVQPPAPAKFAADAYAKYTDLNKRYQAELQKPVGTRELDGLIKEYKDLIATKEGVPASVKQGAESRIAALEKLATIQHLQKEVASSADVLAEQRKALEAQYSEREKAIQQYQRSEEYIAQGNLQTSTTVTGKYALVNPVTGRTVAYVDPASAIDIGSLLGKYIGVHGTTKKAEGTEVQVIQVRDATLLPPPVVAEPKQSNVSAIMDIIVISIGTLAKNPLWNERQPVRTSHATTTLVRTTAADDPKTAANILIDPSLPFQILEARIHQRSGLKAAEITHVFLTNWRPVHRRALEHFPKAIWWMNQPEIDAANAALDAAADAAHNRGAPADPLIEKERALLAKVEPAPDVLAESVDLYPLIGYTPGQSGLLLSEPTRTTLIAGDAVPTAAHFLAGQVFQESWDLAKAKDSLMEIYEVADLIIPGHDDLFLAPRASGA